MIHAFRNQFLERNHNLKYNATLCNLVRGECCLTWITSDAFLADSVGGKKDDLGRKFCFCLFVVWFCFGFFVRVFFFFLKKKQKKQPDTKASKEEEMDKLVRNIAFIS